MTAHPRREGLRSVLFRSLYLRACRAYARRFVGDRPADPVYRLLCSLQFWRVHRFWPDFARPRRFSERLWSRMLHDRDPRLTELSDKLRMREYAASRVGDGILIPLLWSGDDPEAVPFERLPEQFVIKAAHGCSCNLFVRAKNGIDRGAVRRQLRDWLRLNYCEDVFLGIEWAYRNVKPSLLVEALVLEDGKLPVDYKFWCFSGRVECLTEHYDRHERHQTRAFDRDYRPIDFGFLPEYTGDRGRPANFEEMVRVAERLADGFDFVRVDLYNPDGEIRFGELTFYPGGASVMCAPGRWDHVLGEKWASSEAGAGTAATGRA